MPSTIPTGRGSDAVAVRGTYVKDAVLVSVPLSASAITSTDPELSVTVWLCANSVTIPGDEAITSFPILSDISAGSLVFTSISITSYRFTKKLLEVGDENVMVNDSVNSINKSLVWPFGQSLPLSSTPTVEISDAGRLKNSVAVRVIK